jgi:hypothetical protein
MRRRDSEHHCVAVISRAERPDIVRRLEEYERGYADGQADRRSD